MPVVSATPATMERAKMVLLTFIIVVSYEFVGAGECVGCWCGGLCVLLLVVVTGLGCAPAGWLAGWLAAARARGRLFAWSRGVCNATMVDVPVSCHYSSMPLHVLVPVLQIEIEIQYGTGFYDVSRSLQWQWSTYTPVSPTSITDTSSYCLIF